MGDGIVSVIYFLGLAIGGLLAFFGALYVVSKVGVWMENKLNKKEIINEK